MRTITLRKIESSPLAFGEHEYRKYLKMSHMSRIHSVDWCCQSSEGRASSPLVFSRYLSSIILILSLLAFKAVGQSICARVGVQLSQEAVVSRNAFLATLEINNSGSEALAGIGVELEMIRPDGTSGAVHFSGADTPLISGGLTSVDGTGVLLPGTSGAAQWTLIPFDTAAPDEPLIYGFTGTLFYTTSSGDISIPLEPVYLTVLPNPKLRVRYFWERDVFADDPLTLDVVEPIQPFSIAVMLSNVGAGVANNVRFTSAQPRITRNDRGLLIDFRLIGSQVDCQQIAPSLTFNLGDLPPGSTRVARWLMTSTLSGFFEDMRVSMQHIDGLGDSRLSLFEEPIPQPHELIRVVRNQEPGADCSPDFLVSDLSPYTDPPDPYEDPADPERLHLPDHLYQSDGTIEPVVPVFGAVATPLPNLRATISATVPSSGWFYIKLPDPAESVYQIVSLTRADGKQIEVGPNVWQTDRVFRDNSQEPLRLNRLHIFDTGGPGIYTATYADLGGAPRVSTWEVLAQHGSLATPVATRIDTSPEYSEPRINGISTLRVRFSRPIKASTLPSTSLTIRAFDTNSSTIPLDNLGWTTSLSYDQREATFDFTSPLPDAARYCLTLTGVTDPFGNIFADNARVIFTVLEGDASGDKRTNNSDPGAVRSVIGSPFNPGNPQHVRADLNRDGVLNQADFDIAVARRGRDARFIAEPCDAPAPPPPEKPTDFPRTTADLSNPDGPGIRLDPNDRGEPLPRTAAAGIEDSVRPHTGTTSRWASVREVGAGEQAADQPRSAGMIAFLLNEEADGRAWLNELGLDGSRALRAPGSGWWFIDTPVGEDPEATVPLAGRMGVFTSPVDQTDDGMWHIVGPRLRIAAQTPSQMQMVRSEAAALGLRLARPASRPDECCEYLSTEPNAPALLSAAAHLRNTLHTPAIETELTLVDPIAARADINADGRIDAHDLPVFIEAYRTLSSTADIDGNGVVNHDDLLRFFEQMR